MKPTPDELVDTARFALSKRDFKTLKQLHQLFREECFDRGKNPEQIEEFADTLHRILQSEEALSIQNGKEGRNNIASMLDKWEELSELAEHTLATQNRLMAAKQFVEASELRSQILEAVDAGEAFGVTLAEIAEACKISPAVAASRTAEMEPYDLVERHHAGQVVRLGLCGQLVRDHYKKEEEPQIPFAAAAVIPYQPAARVVANRSLSLSPRRMLRLDDTIVGAVAAFARHRPSRTKDS